MSPMLIHSISSFRTVGYQNCRQPGHHGYSQPGTGLSFTRNYLPECPGFPEHFNFQRLEQKDGAGAVTIEIEGQ